MQNHSLQNAMFHWGHVADVISMPKSPQDYEVLLQNIEDAMQLIANEPNPALTSLLTAMSKVAKEYENKNFSNQNLKALDALKYLIKLHGIKQADLKEIGSQGVVSEVLNGKRALTLRHVKELAKRFNVSPNVFIDL